MHNDPESSVEKDVYWGQVTEVHSKTTALNATLSGMAVFLIGSPTFSSISRSRTAKKGSRSANFDGPVNLRLPQRNSETGTGGALRWGVIFALLTGV